MHFLRKAPVSTPDQSAAHELLSELRTRIATQPLPYQHGVEARALESLREVFDQAREAMKKYPGCKKFSAAVTHMLNVELRPFTVKWHRAYSEGRLNSRDGADEFRGDLAQVQKKLQAFSEELQQMAYGTGVPDALSPAVMSDDELGKLFEKLSFGIDTSLHSAANQMNQNEASEVKLRRNHYHITPDGNVNAVGLALSGGGIRSATFSLGVAQVLAERSLLRDVDFLSTVSGGGYTGSFLTMRLGVKGNGSDCGEEPKRVAYPFGPDTTSIQYLRRNAKYMTGINLKQSWSMVTATLAGLVLNWTAPGFVVAVAALLAILASPPAQWWQVLVVISATLTAAALVLYSVLMRQRRELAQLGGTILAALAALTLVLAGGWALAVGHDHIPRWIRDHWLAGGVLSSLILAGPAILRFVPLLETPAIRKIALKLLLLGAGLIIPVGAILLFYAFWFLENLHPDPSSPMWNPLHYGGTYILAGIAFVFALVAGLLLNVNLTAPHRLYRDQLARTFVQDSKGNGTHVPLTGINSNHSAPYQLINAAVNLPSSEHAALRQRKSDFFVFSKHWCGSPATGYIATKEWRTNNHPADLATAMAISGGAVSSHMGLRSMSTLTALLTFLNLRLGFWIHNPPKPTRLKAPGFLCLLREMTGIAMSEKQAWLNLSDGGHLENMGIYELLRRRCKYIICVDGEADPETTFVGFMTLVRHAQIDFGILIDAKLNELRPVTPLSYSQTHTILCRVRYPGDGNQPAGIGLMLYMKLSLTGNESELIKRYRIIHPDFPNQTTLDQFFDEEQFEAYRQLGVHVAEGLFSPALMNGDNPTTVESWFRALARNLLEPTPN